jgi:hypothetical protein
MMLVPCVKELIASGLGWSDLHREQSEIARYLPVEPPIIIQALRDGEPAFKRDSPDRVHIRIELLARS